MHTYALAPHGIFWTVQGEGELVGEPMAFLRLAGCSVGCALCDTDYRVAERATVEQIVARVRAIVPPPFTWPWVWITGGEPTDHDVETLIEAFRAAGFRVALATSGKRALRVIPDWLSVSPHGGDLAQRSGHEIKAVPGLHRLTWEDLAALHPLAFPYRFVQPLANRPEETEKAIAFVAAHPGWRLSLQAHRVWGIP